MRKADVRAEMVGDSEKCIGEVVGRQETWVLRRR